MRDPALKGATLTTNTEETTSENALKQPVTSTATTFTIGNIPKQTNPNAPVTTTVTVPGGEQGTQVPIANGGTAEGSISFTTTGTGSTAHLTSADATQGMSMSYGGMTFTESDGGAAMNDGLATFNQQGKVATVDGTVSRGTSGQVGSFSLTSADKDTIDFEYNADGSIKSVSGTTGGQTPVAGNKKSNSMDVTLTNQVSVTRSESSANALDPVSINILFNANNPAGVQITPESGKSAVFDVRGTATTPQGSYSSVGTVNSNSISLIGQGFTESELDGKPRVYVNNDGTYGVEDFASSSRFSVTERNAIKNGAVTTVDVANAELNGAGSYTLKLGPTTTDSTGRPSTMMAITQKEDTGTATCTFSGASTKDESVVVTFTDGVAAATQKRIVPTQPAPGSVLTIPLEGGNTPQTYSTVGVSFKGADDSDASATVWTPGVATAGPGKADASGQAQPPLQNTILPLRTVSGDLFNSVFAATPGLPLATGPAAGATAADASNADSAKASKDLEKSAAQIEDALEEGATGGIPATTPEQQALANRLQTVNQQLTAAEVEKAQLEETSGWWSRHFGSSSDAYSATKAQINELETERDILNNLYLSTYTRSDPDLSDDYLDNAEDILGDAAAYTAGDGFYGPDADADEADIAQNQRTREYYGMTPEQITALQADLQTVQNTRTADYTTRANNLVTTGSEAGTGAFNSYTVVDSSSATTAQLRTARNNLRQSMDYYERAGKTGTTEYATLKVYYNRAKSRSGSSGTTPIMPPIL